LWQILAKSAVLDRRVRPTSRVRSPSPLSGESAERWIRHLVRFSRRLKLRLTSCHGWWAVGGFARDSSKNGVAGRGRHPQSRGTSVGIEAVGGAVVPVLRKVL
jgi:hypothetical protein